MELKEIKKSLNKIREKWGVNAFDDVEYFIFTLYRAIEDLTKSRDNWKRKHDQLKIIIKMFEEKRKA